MSIGVKGGCTVSEIFFPRGLPGFYQEKHWTVYELEKPFYLLEARGQPEIALPVVSPFLFYPDYSIRVAPDVLSRLSDKNETEAVHLSYEKDGQLPDKDVDAASAIWMVLAVVTLKKPFESSTLNLKAPILLNTHTRMAEQIVLEDAHYDARAPLHRIQKESLWTTDMDHGEKG